MKPWASPRAKKLAKSKPVKAWAWLCVETGDLAWQQCQLGAEMLSTARTKEIALKRGVNKPFYRLVRVSIKQEGT